MADGRHHPERPEGEGPGRFTPERADKIGRKLFCLTGCELRGRRAAVAVCGVGNACAVSDRPDVGAPGDAHVSVCFETSSLQRKPEGLDEWVRGISNGADD